MSKWQDAYARWMAMPESKRKGLNYSVYLWNAAVEAARSVPQRHYDRMAKRAYPPPKLIQEITDEIGALKEGA
jgi:hypothetical protein